MRQIDKDICTDQSIAQVTHSHNPLSLRKIPFNYSCHKNNIVEFKGHIQIHVLLFSIIHTCILAINDYRSFPTRDMMDYNYLYDRASL